MDLRNRDDKNYGAQADLKVLDFMLMHLGSMMMLRRFITVLVLALT